MFLEMGEQGYFFNPPYWTLVQIQLNLPVRTELGNKIKLCLGSKTEISCLWIFPLYFSEFPLYILQEK